MYGVNFSITIFRLHIYYVGFSGSKNVYFYNKHRSQFICVVIVLMCFLFATPPLASDEQESAGTSRSAVLHPNTLGRLVGFQSVIGPVSPRARLAHSRVTLRFGCGSIPVTADAVRPRRHPRGGAEKCKIVE